VSKRLYGAPVGIQPNGLTRSKVARAKEAMLLILAREWVAAVNAVGPNHPATAEARLALDVAAGEYDDAMRAIERRRST
jgi:hypothetical protein